MKIKTLFYCIILCSFFKFSFSQDIKSLNTVEDLDALFNSLKGKTVLVNVWATWCIPCVKEFPELIKLYKNYKDKGFEIVFISVDDKEAKDTKLPEFLKKQGVDFTTYYNEFKKPEEIIDYFDKSWGGEIPATYIYNQNGELVKKLLGSQKYDAFEKAIKDLI